MLQLRKRSKAVEQGLYEGDTILGVNGFSTHGISHAVAMSLIDQTRGTLELVVLRYVILPLREFNCFIPFQRSKPQCRSERCL